MKARDIKWCPQHGYPLPCAKCGMPLSSVQQREVYEAGEQEGFWKVVNWMENHSGCTDKFRNDWKAQLANSKRLNNKEGLTNG